MQIHAAEEQHTDAMISMEEALADQSLPMKIGLNLWFTDRPEYPRPEVGSSAPGLQFGAHDIQEGDMEFDY